MGPEPNTPMGKRIMARMAKAAEQVPLRTDTVMAEGLLALVDEIKLLEMRLRAVESNQRRANPK